VVKSIQQLLSCKFFFTKIFTLFWPFHVLKGCTCRLRCVIIVFLPSGDKTVSQRSLLEHLFTSK